MFLFLGKPSRTIFERESVSPDGAESLVRCRPVTGRMHQIRVHLKWLGKQECRDAPMCLPWTTSWFSPKEAKYAGKQHAVRFHLKWQAKCTRYFSRKVCKTSGLVCRKKFKNSCRVKRGGWRVVTETCYILQATQLLMTTGMVETWPLAATLTLGQHLMACTPRWSGVPSAHETIGTRVMCLTRTSLWTQSGSMLYATVAPTGNTDGTLKPLLLNGANSSVSAVQL